eukprot:3091134-Rhodomonas_salina.1
MLLDVVRETIVFGSLAAMTACVRDISRSPSLVVDRVRNSLSPHADASHWSGFRSVVFNLRITTPISSGVGVSGHVCELVLVLHSFAILQVRWCLASIPYLPSLLRAREDRTDLSTGPR